MRPHVCWRDHMTPLSDSLDTSLCFMLLEHGHVTTPGFSYRTWDGEEVSCVVALGEKPEQEKCSCSIIWGTQDVCSLLQRSVLKLLNAALVVLRVSAFLYPSLLCSSPCLPPLVCTTPGSGSQGHLWFSKLQRGPRVIKVFLWNTVR